MYLLDIRVQGLPKLLFHLASNFNEFEMKRELLALFLCSVTT